MFSLRYSEFTRQHAGLYEELDSLVRQLRAFLSVAHNEDGTLVGAPAGETGASIIPGTVTFTGPVQHVGEAPFILLRDDARPPDGKRFYLQNASGELAVVAHSDAGVLQGVPLRLQRNGSAVVGGTLTAARLATPGDIHLTERGAPGTPPPESAFLFLRDNGAGKTQLAIQFATGAPVVIATQV